ncbi:hypothetical protein [Shimazuella kribbensis]|uniref:hypothetical protein n=1 Tax=Shimazuella kribbensis TaxID=139808 RepID=UPI00040D3CE0|nr:hypothetical protein [Shimazuella kribbensis]
MSIWRYEREVENIKIEIARLEKNMNEKQDDFQLATRRGDESKARQDRREQLQISSKIRLLTRELILAERKLDKETKQADTKISPTSSGDMLTF